MLRAFAMTCLLASVTVHASGASAQGRERTAEERAVLESVQQFFDTMASNDAPGASNVLDSEGSFVSVRWDAQGTRVVRRSSFRDYLDGLGAGADALLERMWDAEVLIHDPIAVVWTRYDFHVNGKFSHCGVDAFQLVRAESGWMITGGTYTVQREGCGESPLGPPR